MRALRTRARLLWQERRPSAGAREEGSAVVEFVMLGVMLLIPLLYLVMMLARMQAGSYAASTAAREAGRAFVTASEEAKAAPRALAAAEISFEDQGFGGEGTVEITCSATPCLTPQASVEVRTIVTVPLPFVPSFVRGVIPLEVPIEATHRLTVDRFRSAP